MSIKNKQEISVHLKNFRNLSTYTVGRFVLRVSIYTQIDDKKYFALPINVIQKCISDSENRPLTDDIYYVTKNFPIKSGSNAEINEICIFRFNVEIGLDQPDYDQVQSYVVIELIQSEYTKSKIVGQYVGRTNGTISDSLIVDFYEGCPGQLIGSIHTCTLSYQFLKGKDQGKSQNYQVYSVLQQVLKYLKEKSDRNFQKMKKNYELISGQKIVQDYKYGQNINLEQADESKEEESVSTIQEKSQNDSKPKRKRRPIFEPTLQKKPIVLKKSFRLSIFEKDQHENCMKIYKFWRQLNEFLFKTQGEEFIKKKTKQFEEKLKNKVGESVIRFKGLKDIDQYSDAQQTSRRNMLINILRAQNKQQQNMFQQFSIFNQRYFTKERPIFFEENVMTSKRKLQQDQTDYFLCILVHGLGACRLDMEKLKVELKRYYNPRLKVYVSSSNQSRTEGDIEAMGTRLAAEVQAEILRQKGSFKVNLIGHSMGGLIIRSALPKLQKFKEKFHSLITFSSPHIGYAYSSSKLVDAGLWLLNTMKRCISIQQMTMTDSQKIQDCFLYKLSQQKGLQWFRKVTFLASHQDSYVPFYSARIQKSKDIQSDLNKGFNRGIQYCKMIDNILSRIEGSLTRLDVNFQIPEQNFDNLIGRAAHISFINNVEMLRTFCIAEQSSLF